MAYDQFPYYWRVNLQESGTVGTEFRTQEIKFGNGYGQTIPDGPNAETKQIPISFVGQLNEQWNNPKDVYDFLRAHRVTPFEYTPADGETGLFIATDVSYNRQSELIATVTATLKTAVGFF